MSFALLPLSLPVDSIIPTLFLGKDTKDTKDMIGRSGIQCFLWDCPKGIRRPRVLRMKIQDLSSAQRSLSQKLGSPMTVLDVSMTLSSLYHKGLHGGALQCRSNGQGKRAVQAGASCATQIKDSIWGEGLIETAY